MKFLFAIHYPIFGGPHNQAVQLNVPLASRGWETLVLLPEEPGNAAERLKIANVAVVQIPLHRLRSRPDPLMQLRFGLAMFPEVARIRQLIRQAKIDLVVVGGLVNPHAAIAARLERIPVVWQLLDSFSPMVVRRAMMPVVRRLADVVLSTGTVIAAAHPKALALGPRLIPYFPPVDVNVFRPSRERRAAARAELGLRDEDLVIGTVGNLRPFKGHDTFLSAAAHLRREHPYARFVILGATFADGNKYTAGLWEKAANLGLRLGRDLIVRDPGSRVSDLEPAFDIFWMTSEPRSEGIPTVVEEAMALGLPVVATDVGGVREAVNNGVNGLVTPARRPDLIAEATCSLLVNARRRKDIGEQARWKAVEYFNVEICADTHIRAFGTAIAHRTLNAGTTQKRVAGET